MGDPVSATGTAVGVISLGLSVCQGLISFYRAWKDYDEDLDGAGRNVGSLLESLRGLEVIFQRLLPHNLDGAPNAAGSLIACRSVVESLERFLENCRCTSPPQSTKEKAKGILRRSLYPFRKATLDDIQSGVTQLQNTLIVALQAVDL